MARTTWPPSPPTPAPVTRRAVLDGRRASLAHRIARRVEGRRRVDPATLEAVTWLTAAADPERAERLSPRPGESAALVERLAVWALLRADDLAVTRAERALTSECSHGSDAITVAA